MRTWVDIISPVSGSLLGVSIFPRSTVIDFHRERILLVLKIGHHPASFKCLYTIIGYLELLPLLMIFIQPINVLVQEGFRT